MEKKEGGGGGKQGVAKTGVVCVGSVKEYTRLWLHRGKFIEHLNVIDEEYAGKRSVDADELECTELYALLNFVATDKRPDFNLPLLEKYCTKAIPPDESLIDKYKPFVDDGGLAEFGFNLPFIVFELLPLCRRSKTKEASDGGPEKLKEFIVNNPEYLFKLHLLECYLLPSTAAFCYTSVYNILLQLEPKKEIPPRIVGHMKRILEYEKKCFYSGSRQPEHIQVLLHYLFQLFIFFPVRDFKLLKEFKYLCLEFRLLPKPYGIIADEFILLLENELRCPCTALLFKIREDFPSIDIYTSVPKESRYADTYEAQLFFDHQIPSLHYLMWKCLPSTHRPQYTQELANELRKYYVLSVLDAYGLAKTKEKILHALGPNSYFNIYSKIIEIMEQCDELSTASCLTYMRAGLEKLCENIPVESRTATEDKFFKTHLYTQYYPDYPIKTFDLRVNLESSLMTILKKYNHVRTHNFSPIVRLICCGNDLHFNKFINAYTRIWEFCRSNEHSKYNTFFQLDIRVYLIPIGFNTLSQYMATYDDVYNQEIFLPFIKEPLLPRLSPEVAKKELVQDDLDKFATYWHDIDIQIARDRQVQMYLREASRLLQLKVCRAELGKLNDPESTMVVYFVYRVEIGMHSTYSKPTNIFTQMSLPEMQAHFSMIEQGKGLPIKLKVMMMNVSDSTTHEHETVIDVVNLSVVNVPSEEDVGAEAKPYAGHLELTYLESIYNKHLKDYMRKKRATATPDNYNKIICHVSSIVGSLHVKGVEVASASASSLPIRIDGTDYTGYHFVKLAIVDGLRVPLMTFLPIHC